jgi:hypothetical protein
MRLSLGYGDPMNKKRLDIFMSSHSFKIYPDNMLRSKLNREDQG